MRRANTVQAWSSWAEIVEFYQSLTEEHHRPLQPMLDFVRQVAASRYARGLHPATSMATLLPAQTPQFEWKCEVLEVEFLPKGRRFRFDFWESPGTKQHWSRECGVAEAFATLQRILRLKRWFLDARADGNEETSR